MAAETAVRLPRWLLGRTRDHGGAAGRRPLLMRSTAGSMPKVSADPNLVGMGCTFTALVYAAASPMCFTSATPAYRLSGDRLTRLTTDHVR